MSRFRTIDIRMWGDAAFCALSRPQPNAQTLWQYLLQGPHTVIIPGLYRAREAALADELGWDLEPFRERFAELLAVRSRLGLEGVMAKADWKAGVVWVPNAINYNPPANPNVVLHWSDALDEIPECSLKAEAYLALRTHCESRGARFSEAFERLPKPSANSFANGSLNRMPNQEQDQEQERERVSQPVLALLPHEPAEPKVKAKPRKQRARTERDDCHDWTVDAFEAAHCEAYGVPQGVPGSLVSGVIDWMLKIPPEGRKAAVERAVAGYFADPYWKGQGNHPFRPFSLEPGKFCKAAPANNTNRRAVSGLGLP